MARMGPLGAMRQRAIEREKRLRRTNYGCGCLIIIVVGTILIASTSWVLVQ